jgi:hypothetical protein
MDAEQNVLTAMTEDYKEGTSAFREKRNRCSRAVGAPLQWRDHDS